MREGWTASELIRSSQGLTQDNSQSRILGTNKNMKLKLSGQLAREVSERRQVGDLEEMFSEKPWWRDVGMDEGV